MATPPTHDRPNWLAISSWSLYDFANTIFSMNIISLYFPLWVTVDQGAEDLLYSIALSLSMVAVALSVPVIGALTDRTQRRLPALAFLTLLSIIATALIGFVDRLLVGLALFVLANYGYHAALVAYDALLPTVSRGTSVGKVAGYGVALGYLGAILGILMVQPFADAGGRGATFLPTAALFLLFALPCFIFIKEGAKPAAPPDRISLRHELKKIRRTLSDTQRYPGLVRFLIANFLYCDAVNTIIAFMSVYAHKAIGFDDASIRLLLIISTVFAVFGSLACGWITHRIGAKRALVTTLMLWLFALLAAAAAPSPALFWSIGPFIGVALGATWVSARSLVVSLSPQEKIGEVYGFYNMGGKFGFICGPLVWGAVVRAFEPLGQAKYRVAVLSLLIFIGLSLWLLRKVPDPRGKGTVRG
jgi:UMF1 family MFS transporter